MSSNGVDITYPPLSKALYLAHDLDEAQQLYVSMLRRTGNIIHSQYAAKLEQARRMLSVSNLKQLEDDFVAFKEHMSVWSQETGIQMLLYRRQKDFLGLNAKIRLYLAEDKHLSQIHDLLGFRIVLRTEYPDTEETVRQCYEALNEVIHFFALSRSCMFLESEPRNGGIISEEEAKKLGIIIPQKTFVIPGFENNVKDYIRFPKSNGYQSLHLLIQTPGELTFEVQVRTTFMDAWSEFSESCRHKQYKLEKYKNSDLGVIDFSKINMPGFKVLPSGELYDSIGLQTSIDPFNVLH